MGWEAQLA